LYLDGSTYSRIHNRGTFNERNNTYIKYNEDYVSPNSTIKENDLLHTTTSISNKNNKPKNTIISVVHPKIKINSKNIENFCTKQSCSSSSSYTDLNKHYNTGVVDLKANAR